MMFLHGGAGDCGFTITGKKLCVSLIADSYSGKGMHVATIEYIEYRLI